MINQLDGWRLDIVLPDKPQHYLTGRLHVEVEYNDNAHAAVVVTATCDTSLYFQTERTYLLQAAAEQRLAVLSNAGRRTVAPQVTVASGSVSLAYGAYSWTLSAGAYQLPDFILRPGDADLYYSGNGQLQISYREAVLR
jgi:hypothetical protein